MNYAKEFEVHAAECAKLAITAPTLALREQYAELSKVWAELARERMEQVSIDSARARCTNAAKPQIIP